jgi:metal-sulfur cluster biosynthetic enzyme
MLKRSGVPMSTAALPTSDEAREALKVIPDPELGINIVDLGLVYDVDVASDGRVHVTYTLTTFGCAIGPMLEGHMQEVLYSLPGVSDVSVEFTLEPKWTRDRMSAEARAMVGDRELHPPSVQDLRTIGGP